MKYRKNLIVQLKIDTPKFWREFTKAACSPRNLCVPVSMNRDMLNERCHTFAHSETTDLTFWVQN